MSQTHQTYHVNDPASRAHLTQRELEVVSLVAEGLSSREVAQRLCRSPRTIENHLRSVYQKLDVRNRVELIRAASERGLFVEPKDAGDEPLQLKGRTLDLIRELDSRMARADNSRYFAELSIALTEVLGVRWAGITEPTLVNDLLEVICVAEVGELRDQTECRASISPCGAILGDEIVVMTDGMAERFPDWDLGISLGVVGYVGVRLDDHLGRAIGTLWIMDSKPIEYSADYVMILRLFGRRTATELTLAQMVDRVGELSGQLADGGQPAVV